MTSNKENFMSLNLSNTYPSVKIVDGSHSPVLGGGVVHATLSLTITSRSQNTHSDTCSDFSIVFF